MQSLALRIVDEARDQAGLQLDARKRAPQAGSELEPRVHSRTSATGRNAKPPAGSRAPTIDQRRVADAMRVGSALSGDREPETEHRRARRSGRRVRHSETE